MSAADQLDSQISNLYALIPSNNVQPGSFGLPGLFPGSGKLTGYALVIKKLQGARQALQTKQDDRAERLYFEALTQYKWCEGNIRWISEGQPIPMLPVKLPRWLVIILYLAAWIGVVGWVAQDHRAWTLVSVPMDFLFWGTLGGATAGIFGVWMHTARGDFDRSYVPWYAVKPLTGGIAGAFVFLVGEAAGASIKEATKLSDTKTALLAAAFVLGFSESLFVSILEIIRLKIRDIINTLFGHAAETEPASEQSS